MAMTIHLEHGSRSAKLALHGLPALKPRPKLQQRSATGEVGSWRIANGIRKDAAEAGFEALRDGDPELDLVLAGTEIDSEETNPAWFDPNAAEAVPIGDFADIDIVYGPDGEEKARRPHLIRRPNLDELHPVKLGKRMPMAEALTGFAFKQMLQLAHTDGLSFEFLRDLAADLAAKQEVAVLGAGPKGNLPLVLREHGSAYRAFLYGAVDESGRYQLLLLLSDQELKLPAAKEVSA